MMAWVSPVFFVEVRFGLIATVWVGETPGPLRIVKTPRAKASASRRIASASVFAATFVRRMNTASG